MLSDERLSHLFHQHVGGLDEARVLRFARAAIDEAMRAREGWIACSERMPDVSQDCLVVAFGGVMPAEWIDRKFIIWRSYNHGTGADIIDGVTHWRPFPDPAAAPKGDAA